MKITIRHRVYKCTQILRRNRQRIRKIPLKSTISEGFWSEWGDSNARSLEPKSSAIPTSLHPDIQFLPLYHGREENQRFFCLWSFLWSKPLLCRFRQPEENPLSPVPQGFAGFCPSRAWIGSTHSQTKRATICATPRCSVLKASVSHETYYNPEGEKMSSVGACKNALTNPARYGTVNAQTRNSTIRARLPDQPKNNDGCEIFRMNGKAAEPRVRGLMLLVPEDFLFSGGQTKT